MCLIIIIIFCAKSFNFPTGLKTQNVEELSLDLIFHNNFLQNVKSFSKQNSKLRIHSKPDRNQLKLTVCTGGILAGTSEDPKSSFKLHWILFVEHRSPCHQKFWVLQGLPKQLEESLLQNFLFL